MISLWSENILCITGVLLSLFRLVLWSKIWSFLVNVPCALEKNVYSVLLGGVLCQCQLGQVGSYVVQVFYILIDFLSIYLVNSWEKGIKTFYYNDGFVSPSSSILPVLLHVFWNSYRCVNIYTPMLCLEELTSLSWDNELLYFTLLFIQPPPAFFD